MVIEQGRLTMAMPTLRPEELLGLIRFGADAVLKAEGESLTDADIETLLQRGEAKTAELAQKLSADCQHSLANFKADSTSDPAKLYELDGVEYDSKGIRELIGRLKEAEAKSADATVEGLDGDMDAAEALLLQLLTRNWSVLRTIKVCQEPGGTHREGFTMADIAAAKLKALKTDPTQGRDAYYTVAKNEVPDRHWRAVADILGQLGFTGIDGDDPSQRCVVIPHELCVEFESRVVAPWHAAWKSFRASQRSNRGESQLSFPLDRRCTSLSLLRFDPSEIPSRTFPHYSP